MTPSAYAANESVHRGRHICLPFETVTEKESAVRSFIHEGLARGKRCLFVGSREDYEKLAVDLEAEGICARRAEARGALVFRTPEEQYLDRGAFDPETVLARLERAIEEALAAGFAGLCATGELMRVPSDDVWRLIVRYEAEINECFARLPFVALCRYPRTVVPPHRVQDVLRTHPVAVVRGEPCDNPFYERPQLALSDDPQSRVDWQLRQMRVQHRAQRRLQDKTASAVTAAVELATELETLRSTLTTTPTPTPPPRSGDPGRS
ncbi:MAG TPA: MEDS domain-containing protein [Polyangia bacterium]|nr:MEDS domain-containing protein [Polyangia bacterium]